MKERCNCYERNARNVLEKQPLVKSPIASSRIQGNDLTVNGCICGGEAPENATAVAATSPVKM